jgi:hypothetical protein
VGAQAGVGGGPHVHVHAQRHGRPLADAGGHIRDALQLVERVRNDGANAGSDGVPDLVARLGHTVEHDLIGPEAGQERTMQLAAGIDLRVDAGGEHLA